MRSMTLKSGGAVCWSVRKVLVAYMGVPAAGVLLLGEPASIAADGLPAYGGWQTGNYKGIDGYLRQSGTVPTNGFHAVWINLCAHDNCQDWVQLGTCQGIFRGGSSPSAVHMYVENRDHCGGYFALDIGAPPTPDCAYYLSYAGTGSVWLCNGDPWSAFDFASRKGSWTSQPFFYGVLSTVDGLAMAKTEVQNGAPIGTDRFGCDHNKNCGVSQSYGMHLYNGTSWYLWTGASTPSNGNPPYLLTHQNYWAYATCPVRC